MFKSIFKKERTVEKPLNKLVFSPVYCEKITGTMYRKGEIIPHARMKVIYEDMNVMVGSCYKNDKTLYFVATDNDVIRHIRKEGAVPLVQNHLLRIFVEKKRMQAYLGKIQVASA